MAGDKRRRGSGGRLPPGAWDRLLLHCPGDHDPAAYQRQMLSNANSRSNTWGAASPLASAAAAPAAIATAGLLLLTATTSKAGPLASLAAAALPLLPPAHPRAAQPDICLAPATCSNVHLLTLKDTGSSYIVRLAHLYQARATEGCLCWVGGRCLPASR